MFKKNAGFIIIIVFIVLSATLVFSSNARAAEKMFIPDLAGIVAFSHAANYMSLEGFVICKCRADYGVEISREEAGKIITAQRSGIGHNKEYSKTIEKKHEGHNKGRHTSARHDKLYSH